MKKTIRHILSLLLVASSLMASGQAEFVPNHGQWHQNVAFRTEIPAGVLYAEPTALTFQLFDAEEMQNLHPHSGQTEFPEDLHSHVYKVHFEGAQAPIIEGRKEFAHYYNFYKGNDESRWASNVQPVQQVAYSDLYENIDLLLYSTADRIKYDFKVKPGADPSLIELRYEGPEKMTLKDGKLIVKTSVGTVTEHEPYCYQLINGKMVEVESAYHLKGNRLTFELGDYDSSYPLIIDPELSFSSYIGSTASNFGCSATDDSQGNLVAASTVYAAGYPTTVGAIEDDFNTSISSYCDMAISKFSADGTQLLYSTYLGGNALEMPHSLICDSQDNIIVMGNTGSPDYPSTPGAYDPSFNGGPFYEFSFFIPGITNPDGVDLFLTKIALDGSLAASTFVGGNDTDGLNGYGNLNYNYGDAFRGEVIVDDDDNVLVASVTDSNDFPVAGNANQPTYNGGNCDAVVFQLNSNLTDLLWSTYIGGSNDESAYSVQLDGDGNVFVTGGTRSIDMPATSGVFQSSNAGDTDGFIAKYGPAGDLLAFTYNGTASYDQNYFVQLNTSGEVFVIGQTEGDIGIVGDVYNNAGSGQYIQKFTSNLTMLELSTTIGTGSGAIDISPTAFLVSECDQVYFSGWGGETNQFNSSFATESTTIGLPTTTDAYQSATDGSDFYLCVLEPDMSGLTFATFFGGSESNEHVDGGTSKFDKDGTVYQAVCAGCGGNSDFPTSPGAWSSTNNSTNCNLGVFKFSLAAVQAEISIDGPSFVCGDAPANFINLSNGASSYEWDFGDGETSTEFEPSHSFDEPGEYTITMVAMDDSECLNPDTVSMTIDVFDPVNPSIDPVEPICDGGTVQLQGNGSENIYWLDDPTLSDPEIANPIASPEEETIYYLVDENPCGADTVSITVEFYDVETTVSNDTTICLGQSAQLFAEGGGEYEWSPTSTLDNPNVANPIATPTDTTEYEVFIVTDEGCEITETVVVNVITNVPGGNVYEEITACAGSDVQLQANPGTEFYWTPESPLNNPNAQNPIAVLEDTTTFYVEIFNACGSGVDEITVNVLQPNVNIQVPDSMCQGEWVQVSASGTENYLWQPASYFQDHTSQVTAVSPPETTELTVIGTDEFGCSDSESRTIIVHPEPFVFAGPDVEVNWGDLISLYGQAADSVDFEWSPTTFMEDPDDLTPILLPDESTYYELSVIDQYGCTNRDTVFVKVILPIYVPNTFTPDGDGLNDVFRAYGDNIREFHMQIYDRWGQLVFESFSVDEVWDGSNKNGDHYVQDDLFVWRIVYETKNGKEELTGHVTILR
ncbi:DUF7948 domain-containing protein [Halocola ammonii]